MCPALGTYAEFSIIKTPAEMRKAIKSHTRSCHFPSNPVTERGAAPATFAADLSGPKSLIPKIINLKAQLPHYNHPYELTVRTYHTLRKLPPPSCARTTCSSLSPPLFALCIRHGLITARCFPIKSFQVSSLSPESYRRDVRRS